MLPPIPPTSYPTPEEQFSAQDNVLLPFTLAEVRVLLDVAHVSLKKCSDRKTGAAHTAQLCAELHITPNDLQPLREAVRSDEMVAVMWKRILKVALTVMQRDNAQPLVDAIAGQLKYGPKPMWNLYARLTTYTQDAQMATPNPDPNTIRWVWVHYTDEQGNERLATFRVWWVCPQCGQVRGEPQDVLIVFKGQETYADVWVNPCGHVDLPQALLAEAAANGLNATIISN